MKMRLYDRVSNPDSHYRGPLDMELMNENDVVRQPR